MDQYAVLDVFVLVVLFFCTALFSATETSLLYLGRVRLANAIAQGGKRGKALEAWRNDPNRLLTTILIFNNALNIAATTVAAFLAVHLSENLNLNRAHMGLLVASFVTAVIIVFGEVSPKLLAMNNAERIALAAIRPLVLVDRFLRPVARSVVWIANIFLRLFGQRPGTHVPVVTEEEIHSLIKLGGDEGVLEDQEHKMLHGVIRLGGMQVREVMVPRIAMECINADAPMEEIINQIIQAGYSRMPVYRDHYDNIIGVVYTKDIITVMQNRELIVLQDVMRQPYFVPETKSVSDLLRQFQKGRFHMAVVVDEYGGTSGLVTLEDLIEEIVGEIQDEYDVEEKNVEKINEHSWIASAQADIEQVNAALEAHLPNVRDLNTIGGFIADLLGHVPRKGEQVTFEDLQFTVLAASSRRVEKVQIMRLPPESPEATAASSK